MVVEMKEEEEEEEEEERFFDSRDELASMSDGGSDCGESIDSGKPDFFRSGLDVWFRRPDSVRERREKFLRQMGLHKSVEGDSTGDGSDSACFQRTTELGDSDSTREFSSTRSSEYSCADEIPSSSMREGDGEGIEVAGCRDLMFRIRNLDDGSEFIVDGSDQDGDSGKIRQLASDRLVTFEEFHRYLGYSPLVQTLLRRDAAKEGGSTTDGDAEVTVATKKGWLKNLRAAIGRRRGEFRSLSEDLPFISTESLKTGSFERVKVQHNRKSVKEFSLLYQMQEIEAHKGSIFTMKFSLDGEYLASAGEDGVIRIWQVIESERTNGFDLHDFDTSCLHLTMGDSSELAPISVDKEKSGKSRRNSSTSLAIVPPRIFRLSDKPVHELKGHSNGVLDLSWSHSKCLLSSSMDETVRLWQLGSDKCLKVFAHNNYVTCVHVDPIDENYFISGSIDGKIRIWSVLDNHVLDWTDIREIVTAVSYSPDGQTAVVGSMSGNCRFYKASGHSLQLETEVFLQSKKRSPSRRVTGFQFQPDSPQKVMVTSADSQVRIFDKFTLVRKYKGFRNASSQISASFTFQGRHIISASEDSHVYIWNHDLQVSPISKSSKSIRSWERFHSSNVSVATSWCGPKTKSSLSLSSGSLGCRYRSSSDSLSSSKGGNQSYWDSRESSPSSSPSPYRFSMGDGLFVDGLLSGSPATWPEEELPLSSTAPSETKIGNSQYKSLKDACINSATAPCAWGLVIVTASWDGLLRSYQNFGLPSGH